MYPSRGNTYAIQSNTMQAASAVLSRADSENAGADCGSLLNERVRKRNNTTETPKITGRKPDLSRRVFNATIVSTSLQKTTTRKRTAAFAAC